MWLHRSPDHRSWVENEYFCLETSPWKDSKFTKSYTTMFLSLQFRGPGYWLGTCLKCAVSHFLPREVFYKRSIIHILASFRADGLGRSCGCRLWGGVYGQPSFALLIMAMVLSPNCLLLQPIAGLKFKKSFHWWRRVDVGERSGL